MLNIWGVMLFIRLSWIVGEAGIGKHFCLSSIISDVNYKLNKQFVFTMNAEYELKVTEELWSSFTFSLRPCLSERKGEVLTPGRLEFSSVPTG